MNEKLEGIVGVEGDAIIHWNVKGVGFGLFYIIEWNNDTGQVIIDNEGMSRDFIKQVLCKMVDDAILADDEPHLQTELARKIAELHGVKLNGN